jgi:hypothetical protein
VIPVEANFRHHHAVRDVQIVLVPIEIGTPRETKRVKPGSYRRDQPTHWRPASKPPNKAQRTVNFLRNLAQRDAEVRAFMEERRHANPAL